MSKETFDKEFLEGLDAVLLPSDLALGSHKPCAVDAKRWPAGAMIMQSTAAVAVACGGYLARNGKLSSALQDGVRIRPNARPLALCAHMS